MILKKMKDKIANNCSYKLTKYIQCIVQITLQEYEKIQSLKKQTETQKEEQESTKKVEINIESLLSDLSTANSNKFLQEFFTGNHRFIALLAEQNRRAAIERSDFIDANL
ncbi:MAG: hypothetical protein LBQ10_08380, partial [Desulfovibrio sp.]|nr:hypothetical protein [Desulfovibrio sp.]